MASEYILNSDNLQMALSLMTIKHEVSENDKTLNKYKMLVEDNMAIKAELDENYVNSLPADMRNLVNFATQVLNLEKKIIIQTAVFDQIKDFEKQINQHVILLNNTIQPRNVTDFITLLKKKLKQLELSSLLNTNEIRNFDSSKLLSLVEDLITKNSQDEKSGENSPASSSTGTKRRRT